MRHWQTKGPGTDRPRLTHRVTPRLYTSGKYRRPQLTMGPIRAPSRVRFARAVAAKNHFCTSADNSSPPLAVTTRNDGSAEPNENERQCVRLGSCRRLARRPRNWSRSAAQRQRTPYKYRRYWRDRRDQFRFVIGQRRRHFWGCHESGRFPGEFPGDIGIRFRLGRNKIRRRRFVFSRQNCA
jgi:hypothetical protein